jgi:hypothetical protein
MSYSKGYKPGIDVPLQGEWGLTHWQTQAKVSSRSRQQCLLHTSDGFLLGLLFNPDEGNISCKTLGSLWITIEPTWLYSLYSVFTMHDSKLSETEMKMSLKRGQVKFHSWDQGVHHMKRIQKWQFSSKALIIPPFFCMTAHFMNY